VLKSLESEDGLEKLGSYAARHVNSKSHPFCIQILRWSACQRRLAIALRTFKRMVALRAPTTASPLLLCPQRATSESFSLVELLQGVPNKVPQHPATLRRPCDCAKLLRGKRCPKPKPASADRPPPLQNTPPAPRRLAHPLPALADISRGMCGSPIARGAGLRAATRGLRGGSLHPRMLPRLHDTSLPGRQAPWRDRDRAPATPRLHFLQGAFVLKIAAAAAASLTHTRLSLAHRVVPGLARTGPNPCRISWPAPASTTGPRSSRIVKAWPAVLLSISWRTPWVPF